jgi:methylthioribulose-1-phosphate dehydratase
VSGTGGGISVLSTGGACIAPSGVQKERMLPHEIFVLSLSSGVPLAMPGTSEARNTS